MTRDEGIVLIQQQLAFRTTLNAEIILNLKLAQTMLEGAPTKPFFLVTENATATTTIDEQRLALPTNFLEETDEAVLTYVPTDSDEDEVPLKKDDYDVLRKNFIGEDSGAPAAYALLGMYFYLFPVPDAEYTIRMIYYKQDTVLDTNVENGWLKYNPYLILGTALKQIAEGPIRDAVAAKVADGWITAGLRIEAVRTESRARANREDQMGGPHA